jgi:hypothetical protein
VALWLALIPFLDVYDRLYAWYWRAEPVGPVLTLDRRRYRGPEQRFPDGTLLHPGDPIGELHLQNRRVLGLHARTRHPLAVGLAFRQRLIASLRVLARRAASEPLAGELRAFHAHTILTTGAERLGFVVVDGAPAHDPIRTLYFHLLLCRYHAAGFRRWPRRLRPTRQLWITAAELRRRYLEAPAAASAELGTRASA